MDKKENPIVGGQTFRNPGNYLVNKKIPIIIFLVCFITLFLFQSYLFIKIDDAIIPSDHHIIRALMYYDNIIQNNNNNISSFPYPPIVYLVTQVFFIFNGVSIESARFALLFFSIIFLLAMFGIGYEIGGYYSGAAAMALAASSHMILKWSHDYSLDFPQTATTALAFFLLLKSDGYMNRKFTLLFWIVLAFSFLTKWSTAFFMFVPVLWFLIPNLFSRRSFFAFLAFLIPASISLISFLWFIRGLEDRAAIPGWLKYYFLIAFLPALVCIGIMWALERKWKKDEEYRKTKAFGIVNFAYGASTFVILATPWYFWALGQIKSKFLSDLAMKNPMHENLRYLTNFFTILFNFSPFLLLVGLVFLFIFRKNLYRRLILPINLIFLFLLLTRLCFSTDRYLLSIIVFAAPLAGFWVCHTRKLKVALTGLIVLISILSILSWILFPRALINNLSSRIPINRPGWIQTERNPHPRKYIFAGPFNLISAVSSDQWKDVFIYESDDSPFGADEIQLEAFKAGKRIHPRFQWSEKGRNWINHQIAWIESGNYHELESINEILIIHSRYRSPEYAARAILRLFPGVQYKSKTFDVGEGQRITVIKLGREMKIRRNLKHSGK